MAESTQSPEILCEWQDSWRQRLERRAVGCIAVTAVVSWLFWLPWWISEGELRAFVYPAAIAIVVGIICVFPLTSAPASFRLCAAQLPDGRARITVREGTSDKWSCEFALPARAIGRRNDGETSGTFLTVKVLSVRDPPVEICAIPSFLSERALASLDAWLLSRSAALPLRNMESARPSGGVAKGAWSASGDDEILFVARAPRCPWIILLATVLGVANMFLQPQYTPWITPTTSLFTLAGLVVVSIWIVKALRVAVVVKGRRLPGGVVELRVRRAGIALPAVRIAPPIARAHLDLAEVNMPKLLIQNLRGDQCRLRGIPERHLVTVWSIVDRWLIESPAARVAGDHPNVDTAQSS